MKKVISVLIVCVLAFAMCVPAFAADSRLNYVLIGDSITEGYGIDNPDEACYGRIIADTNGYTYRNFGRVATDSDDLAERLQEGSNYDYWYGIRDAVADADIISLSIGANDYLANDDVYRLAAGALFRLNNKKLDAIAEHFYDNLCVIIAEMRALNPDAVILLQTVYSVWYGFAANAFDASAQRCNRMIEKYDREHPGMVTICDISPAMNGKPENLADDCVHPNAQGNVAIARLILAQLHDLGLGENTEPVVNTPGVDYNLFEQMIENRFLAKLVSFLVKVLTGNAANIGR